MTKVKTVEELKAAYKAADDDFLKRVIAHNIKAVSISDDVISAVVTAYNKYTGKKIGPATEKKIDAEIQKDFPDVYTYFSRKHFDGVRYGIMINVKDLQFFMSYDESKVELHNKEHWSENLFDENSNFKGLDAENLTAYGKKKYIADTDEYINKKRTQFEAVKEAAETYRKLCNEFRDESVNGLAELPYISVPHWITK